MNGARMAVAMLLLVLCPVPAQAHHFKGLPHFNYFENYPQIPQEEFIAQEGRFEFSLVLYDFQGIDRKNAEMPDNVRFYVVVFDLLANKVYDGPVKLEVLDHDQVINIVEKAASEEEHLYSFQQSLPDSGEYSLRLTMHDAGAAHATIPFRLSSQRMAWGKWITAVLVLLVGVVAFGSRRARVRMDQREARGHRRKTAGTSPFPSVSSITRGGK